MTTTAMANGIDRLERLFSVRKNKHSATSTASTASTACTAPSRIPYSTALFPHRKSLLISSSAVSTAPSSTASSASHFLSSAPPSDGLQDLHFPSPSFIRPKASRMQPRDDSAPAAGAAAQTQRQSFLITNTNYIRRPAPSPPKSSNAESADPTSARRPLPPPPAPPVPSPPDSTVADAFSAFPRPPPPPPQRVSPLLQRRDMTLVPLATGNSNAQLSRPQPSKVQQASMQLQLQMGQAVQTNAAPGASKEAGTTASNAPADAAESLSKSSSQATPTSSRDPVSPKTVADESKPEEPTKEPTTLLAEIPAQRRSPVLVSIVLPQKWSSAEETCPSTNLSYLRPNSSSQRRRVRVARRPLSLRYQRHLPAAPRPQSSSGAVLMEPNLGDFLALSDDDIAEEETDKETAKDAKTDAKPKPAAGPAKTTRTLRPNAKLQKSLPPPPLPPKKAVVSLPPLATTTSSSVSVTSPASPVRPATPPRRLNESGPPTSPPSSQAPAPPAPATPLTPTTPSAPLTPLGTRPRTPIGHARMAAAFEMARIASQHGFDLAYIARIWPKHRADPSSRATLQPQPQSQSVSHRSQPSSASSYSYCSASSMLSGASASTTSTGSTAVSAGRRPSTSSSTSTVSSMSSLSCSSGSSTRLAAQFLAAYGLATVTAPYSLSAPMHAKILRAKEHRWLSFHEPDAQAGEFFRGYGCAFGRGDAADEADAASSGLVFVAYQRKAANGAADAKVLPAADLEVLRNDVAALMSRLLAVHLQQQQQQTKATTTSPSASSGCSHNRSHDVTCTLRRSRFLGVRATA